jgi:hypothetical protein
MRPNSRRRTNQGGRRRYLEAMTTVLAIRLHSAASFREKLRQLIGKYSTKSARKRALSNVLMCRVRGKF